MVTSKLGKEFIVVPGASRHLGNNTVLLGSHTVNLQAAPEDIRGKKKFRVEKTTPDRRRVPSWSVQSELLHRQYGGTCL